VIDPAEIRWIEAARACVRLHLAGETVSFRAQMGEITRRFHGLFIRVHRRAAVRVELIRELRQGGGSPPSVVMADGTTLRIGRRYRAVLETTLRSPS
jgi:two-component system LytT family response regulator